MAFFVIDHDSDLLRLERRALDDAEHERREPVTVRCCVLDDRAHERHVVILDAVAQGVRQQHLGHVPREHVRVPQDRLPQRGRAVDRRAVGQVATPGRLSRRYHRPPAADAVEVLEGEADRVHELVAARARRILAVLLHAVAHRLALPGFSSSGGTSAGGGGGGVPRMFVSTYLPRVTGDVRLVYDVSARTLPWPSRPLRASSRHRDAAELVP